MRLPMLLPAALLALTSIVVGCASTPPAPTRQVPEATRIGEDHTEAYRAAAEFRARGQPLDAISEIDPFVARHPWHVPTHLLWQDLLTAAYGAEAARAWYTPPAPGAEDDPARGLLVARLLPEDDPRRDAEYARAATEFPKSPWPRLALADAALRRADRFAEKALALEDAGHSAEAVVARQAESAAVASAIEDARRATEIAPDLADAFGALADAMFARRARVPGADVEPAVGPARRAVELDPSEPRHQVRLAGALGRAGDDNGAAAALTAAAALAPQDGSILARLGRVRLELRDAKGARDVLAKSVKLRSTDPAAWHDLGVAEFRLGDHGAAIAAFRRAVAIDPSDPRSAEALALAFAAAGQREEAALAMEAYVANGGRDRDRAKAFIAEMRAPKADGR